MKRTKQVQMIIDKANETLKNGKFAFANREDNTPISYFFTTVCTLLLAAKSYEGFNEFYTKEINGKEYTILVGSEDIPNEKRFIQFY